NFPAEAASFVIPAHTTATLLLDHGHLTNAYPQLTVSGGRGASVTLRYAESLFDSMHRKGHRDAHTGRELLGVADRFLPDGGAHRRFAPIDFRTYRYLQLEIETDAAPLTIEDLHGVFTGYPFAERARFRSDDPALGKIWEVAWRTA